MNTGRLAWFASRGRTKRRRGRWTPAEVERLESLIGKKLPHEIARELGRPYNGIVSKAQRLGYEITKDLVRPIGINACAFARELKIPYCELWRQVRSGRLPALRPGRKDYVIKWKDARKFKRRHEARQRRRARILAGIQERTLTKQQFMKFIGLCETHATRYLQAGIVRAWKLPTLWIDTPHSCWEWRVSLSDARRVKKLRQAGRLSLRSRRYRRLQTRDAPRRVRKAPPPGGRQPRRPVLPGWLSLTLAARRCGLPESRLQNHITAGLLKAKRVKVGRNAFTLIHPRSLDAYLKLMAGRRLRSHHMTQDKIRRMGRLTVSEAAARVHLSTAAIIQAVRVGRLRARRVGRLLAIHPTALRSVRGWSQRRLQ